MVILELHSLRGNVLYELSETAVIILELPNLLND